MDHDSQKNMFHHIFFPICKRKEFQLLENFKKKLANAPSSTEMVCTGRLIEQNA